MKLLQQMVGEIRLTAGAQEFEINCEEITVNADHDKIGTVLTNLLSNAVKYAKDKRVTIRAVRTQDSIFVSIKDEGQGIKESDLHLLRFLKFYITGWLNWLTKL